MKREDLRLLNCDANCDHSFPVSDADLAALGYQKRPTCTECGGSGNERHHHGVDASRCMSRHAYGYDACPKCGGSGYGRLVSLDVDVEVLRREWKFKRSQPFQSAALLDLARQVLAAHDGEET